MKNESKNVKHEGIPEEDREFYIGGAVLTALSVAIALIAT